MTTIEDTPVSLELATYLNSMDFQDTKVLKTWDEGDVTYHIIKYIFIFNDFDHCKYLTSSIVNKNGINILNYVKLCTDKPIIKYAPEQIISQVTDVSNMMNLGIFKIQDMDPSELFKSGPFTATCYNVVYAGCDKKYSARYAS